MWAISCYPGTEERRARAAPAAAARGGNIFSGVRRPSVRPSSVPPGSSSSRVSRCCRRTPPPLRAGLTLPLNSNLFFMKDGNLYKKVSGYDTEFGEVRVLIRCTTQLSVGPRPWLACSPHYRHSHCRDGASHGCRRCRRRAVTSSHLERQKLNWATRNSDEIVAAPLPLCRSGIPRIKEELHCRLVMRVVN